MGNTSHWARVAAACTAGLLLPLLSATPAPAEGVGIISGTVTGPDGLPLEGVGVQSYSGVQFINGDFDTTDSSGYYELQVSDEYGWHVAFDSPVPDYAFEEFPNFHPGQVCGAESELLWFDGSSVIDDVDARLETAARIKGTVLGADGLPMRDVIIESYRQSPCSGEWVRDGGFRTDQQIDGSFDIGEMMGGTYRFLVDDMNGQHESEWFDDAADVETAKSITVADAQTHTLASPIQLELIPGNILISEPPSISGTPRVGSRLTGSAGSYTPSSGTTVGFQWVVGSSPVAGATSATFVPRPRDAGQWVRLVVSYTRSGGEPVVEEAESSARVASAPTITNSAMPAITGQPIVGRTLRVTPGRWNPSNVTLRYQWLANNQVVRGATGTTFRLTAARLRMRMSVRVTASSPGRTSLVKTTRSTAAVRR